jgi:hypothetical protein
MQLHGFFRFHGICQNPCSCIGFSDFMEFSKIHAAAVFQISPNHSAIHATCVRSCNHSAIHETCVHSCNHSAIHATSVRPCNHSAIHATSVRPCNHSAIHETCVHSYNHSGNHATCVRLCNHSVIVGLTRSVQVQRDWWTCQHVQCNHSTQMT